MTTKRGRPKIKPNVKRTIYAKALKEKKTPRLALAVELKHLIEEMGEIPPSEETMIKLISQARNSPASPIDTDWSLASLPEYPISADALPTVMSIYARRILQGDGNEYLTIREALWIARLYKLPDVEDAINLVGWKDPNSWPISELARRITVEDLVDDWASTYAGHEQFSEHEGEPFDSHGLDAHILIDVYEYGGK
jgi:hypothetical protein|tara:strand:+ start:110 stop:697 length:588 start_codon:yes stop_codon:yes gene_type:complete